MANKSTIEWTEVTWNPLRGCTKISPGCKNCYAEAFAQRFEGVSGHPYELGFKLRLLPEKLLEPFTWPRSSTVFVNSMSDLFHSDVPDSFIVSVVRVMVENPWHTFQVLTKRADRLSKMLNGLLSFASGVEHIWWGVSVEDRHYGLPRLEYLRSSAARIKFLSIEPLLEDLGSVTFTSIDWVIVGGESGLNARPMEAAWVRNIRDSCANSCTPFFFKQWGGRNKKLSGRTIDGRTHDAMPHQPKMVFPARKDRLVAANDLSQRLTLENALFRINGTI